MTQQELQILQYVRMLNNPWYATLLTLLVIWTLVWKGIALWKSARNGHTVWYVLILLLNTVGILEIIYIFFFSKKKIP